MLIQYYADSLGLPRPGHVSIEERYISLLENWFRKNRTETVFVVDRSRGGSTIDKLYEVYQEDEGYFDNIKEKDILIIHEGICDCAPRPVPLAVRDFISSLPIFLKVRIIRFIHRNRARLLRNGFAYYLVSKKKFEADLKAWLEKALKRFDRIYLFTIAPTNDQIEAHSPGLQKSIVAYNESIKKVVALFNDDRINLIDMHSVIFQSQYPLDELIIKEDGHHLTALAHQIYAQQIIDREMKIIK